MVAPQEIYPRCQMDLLRHGKLPDGVRKDTSISAARDSFRASSMVYVLSEELDVWSRISAGAWRLQSPKFKLFLFSKPVRFGMLAQREEGVRL